MPRRSYFDTFTLTFNNPTGGGYLDSTTRKWVEGSSQSVEAIGDLQPYIPKGAEQKSPPTGFMKDDMKMFVSGVDLKSIDDYGDTLASRTEISGRNYFVWKKYDFTQGRLSTDTNFYVLVLEKLKDDT